MSPDEAFSTAMEILEEEQRRPTVDYADTGVGAPTTQSQLGRTEPERMNLYTQRGERTRHVFKQPERYKFHSSNFENLSAVYGQVEASRRGELMQRLAALMPVGESAPHDDPRFPTWRGQMSYLPLLLEFCIRTGHTREVLGALEMTVKARPGVVIVLSQLGEMIALNFNLFSRQELDEIPKRLEPLMVAMAKLTIPPSDIGRALSAPPMLGSDAWEIQRIVEGIKTQCKQARFHYLSASLRQAPNLEVEADRRRVEQFLTALGFSALLVSSLNQAEAEYASAGSTPFSLKNCLGHLRSVVEHLHIDACRAIANATPGLVAQSEFGNALAFLRKNAYLSAQEESLVGGLFRVLSDQGVHPLVAEREYARLLRNMTIEYGLMFLTVLDKKGVRIS